MPIHKSSRVQALAVGAEKKAAYLLQFALKEIAFWRKLLSFCKYANPMSSKPSPSSFCVQNYNVALPIFWQALDINQQKSLCSHDAPDNDMEIRLIMN